MMTDADLDRLRELAEDVKCVSHDGKHCLRCGRPMIVGGSIQTLRSCAAVPELIDEVKRLRANDAACVTWSRRTVEGIEILKAQLAEMTERAENAEAALRAPEVHWECQQKIDALEVERDGLRKELQLRTAVVESVIADRCAVVLPRGSYIRELTADRDKLRAALAEAIGIFDATWCPEWGHQPKQDQHDRMAELKKLVGDP